MKRLYASILLFAVAPGITLAQTTQGITANSKFSDVVNLILRYVNLLIVFVIGLTLVILIWGVARAWIFGEGSAEKVEAGKQIALWGVIGLVIMVAVWGIIALVRVSLFSNLQ